MLFIKVFNLLKVISFTDIKRIRSYRLMAKIKKNNLVAPFVKWAGGKRQLLPELVKRIPKFTTYCEPFVGGGALLLHLQPQKAIVNDFNKELINTYIAIKDDIEQLIQYLLSYKNDSESYYKVRELDRSPLFNNLSDTEKASRLIYLNKTCYNGLFRVNSQGEFNSPFGSYKSPNIVNEPILRAVHNYLNNAAITFLNGDFEIAVKNLKKGTFVYFDPPYDPVSTSSNFTGYTNVGFGRQEQVRLKNVCDELNSKGIKFLLSNSSTDFILDLYKEYKIEIIPAKRIINSNASLRGNIDEVLIRNYEN